MIHSQILANLPEPTPELIRSMRLSAGLTQREAAAAVGLNETMRWSDYERNVHGISRQHWALFLLATGQHPQMRIAVRRRSDVRHSAVAG